MDPLIHVHVVVQHAQEMHIIGSIILGLLAALFTVTSMLGHRLLTNGRGRTDRTIGATTTIVGIIITVACLAVPTDRLFPPDDVNDNSYEQAVSRAISDELHVSTSHVGPSEHFGHALDMAVAYGPLVAGTPGTNTHRCTWHQRSSTPAGPHAADVTGVVLCDADQHPLTAQ